VICETSSFAIYSSGKRRHSDKSRSVSGLPDHQRSFVQIVADILQSARTLYDLERCRDDMQEFFPQEIRNLLRKAGPAEAFRTATVEAAILFCDLRGSSRFAEQTHDLPAAWSRIRAALGIMTGAITGQNGCIGDFQGDAAMAFWGWPRRGASEGQLSEDVTHACQAADKLRERFLNKSRETGPLSDFTCGIGIAAGDVVAGMLGTEEQRKIGVFGHAVNLAARLESMTKHWGVSILIDDCAEQALRRDRGSRASALTDRLRFLAAVQPGGMDNSVRIFELLLPPAQLTLPLPLLKRFEVGRQAFVSGDWDDARHQLNKVAAAGDGPSRFLLAHMDRLGHPPPNWDGNVVMTGK
jgi:adenylate cyclase